MSGYKNWTRNYWGTRPISNNWFKFNLDTDKDGVKDFKDCRPLNPRKQDLSKEDEEKLRKIEELYDSSEEYKKKIIKEHPESEKDIRGWPYDIEYPSDLDPLVKPVVDEIYKKGYRSASSCQGRALGDKHDHSFEISITIQNDRRLIEALMNAGFRPQFLPGLPTGFIDMVYPKELPTKQELKNIWKRAYEEVKKLK